MKKLIKVLVGIASIIGITALIKCLFCKKEEKLIEVSNPSDINEECEIEEEIVE